MLALVLNLVLAVVLTPVFEAFGAKRGVDVTVPADYDEDLVLSSGPEGTKEALG